MVSTTNKMSDSGQNSSASGLHAGIADILPGGVSRRTLLKGAGAAGVAAGLGILGEAGAIATPVQQMQSLASTAAQEMPEGAAAADQQVLRGIADPTISKALDFYETVYNTTAGVSDLFS